MIDLNAMFEGGLMPMWFAQFAEAPEQALGDLLVGRADVGVLVAEEPSMLLLDWLERFADTGGFAPAVDEALAQWIDHSWGNPTLEAAGNSASMTAVAWCRVAEVIALASRLCVSAARLRERMVSDRHFLGAMTEGRSRDPQGWAWLAVARHQTDRDLLDEWWRLCSLPPDEPWYRGEYGIHGLRGLPAADAHENGRLPEAIARGLAILGRVLNARASDGWLNEGIARDEFLRTARMTMAAYPFEEVWDSFWREAVNQDDAVPEDWVARLADLEEPTYSRVRRRHVSRVWARPDRQWSDRATGIAQRLEGREESAIGEAERLLQEQARYAERTGDVGFVVRSACNFANSVSTAKWRPDKALEWASVARRHDPWNPHGWTVAAKSLFASGRAADAVPLAAQAVQRFPHNAHAYTALGGALRAAGRLSEAMAVCQEAGLRFPGNVVVHSALEEVRQETARRGDTEGAWIQETMPEEEPLAAEDDLTGQDVELLLTDAYLLRRWGRRAAPGDLIGEVRDRARDLLGRLSAVGLTSSLVAWEAGLLRLEIGELGEATALLGEAQRRFPGSARVRYVLARAERELARRERRRLAEAEQGVLGPWRALARQYQHYEPLRRLGEGRAYLALADGSAVEDGARDAFGRLGRWISRHIEYADDDAPGGPPTGSSASGESFPLRQDVSEFSAWWASQAQALVFGDTLVNGADDLPDLDPVRQRLQESAVLLDRCEEEYVLHYASV